MHGGEKKFFIGTAFWLVSSERRKFTGVLHKTSKYLQQLYG